ncbi:MAG: hypothetical protein WCS43_04735 [Verrucomicrobiota bacterium]
MDSRGRAAVKTYLTEQVKQTRPDAAATSELEVNDDPMANRLVLRCHFRSEAILTNSQDGKMDLFFLVPYSIPSRITGVSATRKYPLAILHPVDVQHTIRLNPETPRNLNIPKQTVRSEFFWFSFATTTTWTESTHVFTFATSVGTVPFAKVRDYSNDLKDVSDALNWHIRFSSRDRKNLGMRR